MKIEDLSKTQIVMLCLLITFVTSIATGITTVTLMEQAPVGVTQTINRVIQKTIETVVPDTGKTPETVIVKEEDLVVDALAKNSGIIVPIRIPSADLTANALAATSMATIGYGFLVSADGFLITPSSVVSDKGNYSIETPDGVFTADFVKKDDHGFSVLKANLPTGANIKVKAFKFGTLGDSNSLKLGQTVLATSNKGTDVSRGIITSLPKSDATDPKNPPKSVFSEIGTTLKTTSSFSGVPVINLDGQIIGVMIETDAGASVVPTEFMIEALVKPSSPSVKV